MTLITTDVETGGFDCRRNALLSISLIELATDLMATSNRLSLFIIPEPDLAVDEGAARVNGYTPELWEARGAIPLRQAMGIIADWLPRDPIALAYNARFDQRFYHAAEHRTGISTRMAPGWECAWEKFKEIDSSHNLRAPNHQLATLATMSGHWGPGYNRGTHQALDDALACAAGYRWLCNLRKP